MLAVSSGNSASKQTNAFGFGFAEGSMKRRKTIAQLVGGQTGARIRDFKSTVCAI